MIHLGRRVHDTGATPRPNGKARGRRPAVDVRLDAATVSG
jgi:hypothetical protein